MATKSELVTAQELLDMPDDGYRYELVTGGSWSRWRRRELNTGK